LDICIEAIAEARDVYAPRHFLKAATTAAPVPESALFTEAKAAYGATSMGIG
jgi:hypothetical protein